MDKYYRDLLKVKAVTSKYHNARTEFVTPSRIREIHKMLSTAFSQAVKWELIPRNPVEHATLPKEEKKERAIWDTTTLIKALDACEDDMLKLAINLAKKARKTNRRVSLEPMNPHERKIVHLALQNDRRVETHSEGEEPNRYIVIELKK